MTAQMDGRPPSMSLSRHLPLVPFSHAAYLVYWQLVLLMARTLPECRAGYANKPPSLAL